MPSVVQVLPHLPECRETRRPARSRVAGLLVAVATVALAVGLVLGRMSAPPATQETAAPASGDADGLPPRLDVPRPTAALGPGELREPQPLSPVAASPDVRDGPAPVPRETSRRAVRRAAVPSPVRNDVSAPVRQEPITHAEAEAQRSRPCARAPVFQVS